MKIKDNEYIIGLYDIINKFTFDKKNLLNQYIIYMLDRTNEMFKWKNLPETVDKRLLETWLQTRGIIAFTNLPEHYIVYFGEYGGNRNEYYEPKNFIVANPYNNFNKTLTIGEDCEVIFNDSAKIGVLPLFCKYACMLTENDITMRIASINLRIPSIISASDDRTERSAKVFLDNVIEGKTGIIQDGFLDDTLKTTPYSSTSQYYMSGLIEYEQYLKASWYNDLGINSNYNMKRAQINSYESQQVDDALLPLVDNMLKERKEACERINKHFGLNIDVELDSAWLKEHKKQELETLQNSVFNENTNDSPINRNSEVETDDRDTND